GKYKTPADFSKDRVEVITRVAYLDDMVLSLLQRHLTLEAEDRLLSEGGPMGTFVLRAKLCLRLGMFSISFYSMLKALAEIRNICAHDKNNIEIFKMDKTKSFVNRAWSSLDKDFQFETQKEVKDRFFHIITVMTVELVDKLNKVEPAKIKQERYFQF
ncbi:MAG: Mannitol repressor, partial [Candidatus Saccharibacteria bacterium]|nr:Mannitol repressor [Candidatus Saccharibacteria bacterium]